MPTETSYLIIGAGIAGLTAATSIRSLERSASIILINGEPYAPYKRTNLSKFFATGFTADDFTLSTAADLQKFYNIQLRQDYITEINYDAKLAIGAQDQYQYQYLILATGARYELPQSLQHPELAHKLKFYHNKQETFSLQSQVQSSDKIAVLGGGVQGVETCYELLKLGITARLIDPHDAPLARFKSPYISAYLKRDLERRGAQCFWQQRICQYEDSILKDCDLAICCFGTQPVANLFPAGAQLQEDLRITPEVFVCGDNLEYPVSEAEFATTRCMLWHEAMDLGQAAGLNAARRAQNSELIPYVRKNYRTKIEVADVILFLAPPLQRGTFTQKHFLVPGTQDKKDLSYYQFFLDRQDRITGANLLCRDRERLKPLQQLIWDHRDISSVCEVLQIPASKEFDGLFVH